jgi:hypothetical protein
MKNITEKQTENQELNSRQILSKKLNDKEFAYEFYNKKLQRAKIIIDDILSVTTGFAVPTESGNEWGHQSLLELFGMFSIRHENFSRSQFTEDLQNHVFTWTKTHDEAHRKWQKEAFAARGFDEHGVEIELLERLKL